MFKIISQQTFSPSFWGFLINPYFITRRRIFRSVAKASKYMRGDILDFGCGSRPYERLFKHNGTYIGLDIEDSGHPDQKKRADIFYNGKTIPLPDRSIDGVIAIEVLEHVFNIDEIMSEFHRVLTPNGHLFITIPFSFPEHEEPYDFARYTSFGMSSILQRHGFEIIELEKFGTTVNAIGQLMAAYWFGMASSAIMRAFVQFLFCVPITVVTELAARVLPKDDRMFCGLAVAAVKKGF